MIVFKRPVLSQNFSGAKRLRWRRTGLFQYRRKEGEEDSYKATSLWVHGHHHTSNEGGRWGGRGQQKRKPRI